MVWGGQKKEEERERSAEEKKSGRLVHLRSLSVPKPFDPLCLPLHVFLLLLHGDAERGA